MTSYTTYFTLSSPDDRDTARFCRECINLIGTLSDIAEKAFDGICASNIPAHDLWEVIKREKMLFIFTEASYGFRVTLTLFRFEEIKLSKSFFLRLLMPDPRQLCGNIRTFPFGDGVEHVSLFMDGTSRAERFLGIMRQEL
jgi:hypothetical protein